MKSGPKKNRRDGKEGDLLTRLCALCTRMWGLVEVDWVYIEMSSFIAQIVRKTFIVVAFLFILFQHLIKCLCYSVLYVMAFMTGVFGWVQRLQTLASLAF